MVTICTRVSQLDRVLGIADRFPEVWCTVGIHPHEAASEPEMDADRLSRLASHPKVVGIGETGLDYYYEHSPREAQARSFRSHILAAQATGLPLVVHTREADADMAAMLQEATARQPFSGVLHCFSSSRRLAEQALGLGLYISLSGIVTFKAADELRGTVRDVPMDRLLVETDSPYLAPVPKRGKRNEPAFVAHTAAVVAGLKGVSVDAMARQTTDNFFRLFGKVARPETAA
jgi:TatD DNase family protein